MPQLHPHARAVSSSGDTSLSQQFRTRYHRMFKLEKYFLRSLNPTTNPPLPSLLLNHVPSVLLNCLFGAERQIKDNIPGFQYAVFSMN